MKKLLLKQTTTETWQALVQESAVKASITLSEELESYLVFLLMRFSKEPTLAMSVLATEYLNAQTSYTGMRKDSLKDVGDKCLLFSGFYPGRARKKNVTIDYFVQLGRTAYSDLSDLSANSMSLLYFNLSTEFISLMEVLLASWEQQDKDMILSMDIEQTMKIIQAHKPWRQWH